MLKVLGWSVGLFVSFALGVFALEMIASETGEVVVLHTLDDAGSKSTRLWVVELDGDPWLRSGGGASGWYGRLAAAPRVRFERQSRHFDCNAVPTPAARDEINALMAAKYGWRDRLIGLLVGGRDEAIPVRLRCVSADAPD